jgi:hypothetical protein
MKQLITEKYCPLKLVANRTIPMAIIDILKRTFRVKIVSTEDVKIKRCK